MIADLFSAIDGNNLKTIWITPLLIVTIIIVLKIFSNSYLSVFSSIISSLWSKEVYKFRKLILLYLFLFIITNNLLGLVPLVFSTTTRLWINSSLAIVIWGSVLTSGWFFSFKQSVAHLAPAGAPLALIPFLVLIETIRILIRPITLTVRLIANIRAGHIILSLISNVLRSSIRILPLSLRVTVIIFYNLFEVFVSVIQAYIFTLLISLYLAEHP